MLIFGNTGFIGYPVLSAIFGPQTVVYAVVYNIVFNLLSFTFGAWLIASDNEYGVKVRMSWRDFVTPCNIATLITMALAFCGVHALSLIHIWTWRHVAVHGDTLLGQHWDKTRNSS